MLLLCCKIRENLLGTFHKCFKQDYVKVIWTLLLSMVDCNQLSVLVNAQSLETEK